MSVKVRIFSQEGQFIEIRDFSRVPNIGENVGISGNKQDMYTVERVYFPTCGMPRIQLSSSKRLIRIQNTGKYFFE